MRAGMERVVFYRERGALPYDPFAFGVAIALVEVPYLILQVRADTGAAAVHLLVKTDKHCQHHTVVPCAITQPHQRPPPAATGLRDPQGSTLTVGCPCSHVRRICCRCWCRLQALLFVPVIYVMIGFSMVWEKALYYAFMFLASISFYTIFGQFMVYVTPSQQVAQVRN